MKKWWDELGTSGPKYGYYPLARKTVLIVKPEYEETAKDIFAGSGVKITTGGERHMGAVIGSADFKEKYVKEKSPIGSKTSTNYPKSQKKSHRLCTHPTPKP